jgi:hypothetical protein
MSLPMLPTPTLSSHVCPLSSSQTMMDGLLSLPSLLFPSQNYFLTSSSMSGTRTKSRAMSSRILVPSKAKMTILLTSTSRVLAPSVSTWCDFFSSVHNADECDSDLGVDMQGRVWSQSSAASNPIKFFLPKEIRERLQSLLWPSCPSLACCQHLLRIRLSAMRHQSSSHLNACPDL